MQCQLLSSFWDHSASQPHRRLGRYSSLFIVQSTLHFSLCRVLAALASSVPGSTRWLALSSSRCATCNGALGSSHGASLSPAPCSRSAMSSSTPSHQRRLPITSSRRGTGSPSGMAIRKRRSNMTVHSVHPLMTKGTSTVVAQGSSAHCFNALTKAQTQETVTG